MKKRTVILTGMAFFVAIGAAVAVKAKTFTPRNLFYKPSTSCIVAPATSINTGLAPTVAGPFYTSAACTKTTIGYRPTAL